MVGSTSSNDSMRPEPKVRCVLVKRSAKATEGGRRFSFSALVVVGDSCGRVGFGLGKSGEVANAIQKATDSAAAKMVAVALKAGTIPHEVSGDYCGAKMLLRPASRGTRIIASRTVRAVLECAGVKDAICKSLGAHNAANVVKATLQALMSLRLPERVYQDRGLKTRKAKAPVLIKFPDPGAGQNPLHWN